MKALAAFLLTVVAIGSSAALTPSVLPIDKLLTIADVETATGKAGIKTVPRNPSIGAGGDLNFATPAGDILVMVQVVDVKYYAQFKRTYFKTALAGAGDEAFTGAPLGGNTENFACFKKDAQTVAVTGFLDLRTGKSALTRDQVVALAKIIASRM
jgi:hypothetical protein